MLRETNELKRRMCPRRLDDDANDDDDDGSEDQRASVLDDLFVGAWNILKNVAHDVAPRCCECGELALPLECICCGHHGCVEHVFVNPSTRQAICLCCAAEIPDRQKPRKAPARPRERRQAGRSRAPWEILGLSPGASEADVRRAFRRESFGCHPDLHPDDEGAARRFRGLQRARELCLEELRRGS